MATLIPKSTYDEYQKKRDSVLADLAAFTEETTLQAQEFPHLGLLYIRELLLYTDQRLTPIIKPFNLDSVKILDYEVFDSVVGDLSGLYGLLLLTVDSLLLTAPLQEKLSHITSEMSSLFSTLHLAPLAITPKAYRRKRSFDWQQ